MNQLVFINLHQSPVIGIFLECRACMAGILCVMFWPDFWVRARVWRLEFCCLLYFVLAARQKHCKDSVTIAIHDPPSRIHSPNGFPCNLSGAQGTAFLVSIS